VENKYIVENKTLSLSLLRALLPEIDGGAQGSCSTPFNYCICVGDAEILALLRMLGSFFLNFFLSSYSTLSPKLLVLAFLRWKQALSN